MNLSILTYFLGSFYIMKNIFSFSYNTTDYLYKKNIINFPESKFEKINEVIYSSIHCILISVFSILSVNKKSIDFNNFFNFNLINNIENNELMILTLNLSLNYFIFDLIRCIYYKKYLFLIHHACAIQLLIFNLMHIKLSTNSGLFGIITLFLLESNNILLNIGYLLKEFKIHYSITCTSWIIHLFFFSIFRLIEMPKVFIMYLLYEENFIFKIIQIPSLLVIYAGSFYWAHRQYKGIGKYLKENSVI